MRATKTPLQYFADVVQWVQAEVQAELQQAQAQLAEAEHAKQQHAAKAATAEQGTAEEAKRAATAEADAARFNSKVAQLEASLDAVTLHLEKVQADAQVAQNSLKDELQASDAAARGAKLDLARAEAVNEQQAMKAKQQLNKLAEVQAGVVKAEHGAPEKTGGAVSAEQVWASEPAKLKANAADLHACWEANDKPCQQLHHMLCVCV